jgi:hypothetical protein
VADIVLYPQGPVMLAQIRVFLRRIQHVHHARHVLEQSSGAGSVQDGFLKVRVQLYDIDVMDVWAQHAITFCKSIPGAMYAYMCSRKL